MCDCYTVEEVPIIELTDEELSTVSGGKPLENLEGIKGESQDSRFKNSIEIDSW